MARSGNSSHLDLEPGHDEGNRKIERSARYIVRLQKNGQYMVVMMRPEWANREIPGFTTEKQANSWIAGRRQQSKL